MNATGQKHELRQTVLQSLRNIPAEQREASSAALRMALAPWLNTPRPLTIALYAPLPHEVNLLPLLSEFPQHRYGFPRCRKHGEMHFHLVRHPESELRPAALGIPAPIPEIPLIPPAAFDLILVPGVAFTQAGAHLGYGGGYYDRYLPHCPRAALVAAAFAQQIVPDIPTEPHDLTIPHLIIH